MSTNEQNQAATITTSELVSTPVRFAIKKEAGGVHVYSTFLDTRTDGGNTGATMLGSIVTNRAVPGASMQVIPTGGIYKKTQTQRLLLSGVSPKSPVFNKTIDFLPIFPEDATPDQGQNLTMVITDKVHGPDTDVGDMHGDVYHLRVGPDASVMITHKPGSAAEMPLINWGNAFNIARVVVPGIAKAGYSMYKELNKPTATGGRANEVYGIFDSILSVAKVAVPIAGSLLEL